MATKSQSESDAPFPKGVAKPARRALASVGVFHLSEVTRLSEVELRALHGMGPTAIASIKAALKAQGKSLAEDK